MRKFLTALLAVAITAAAAGPATAKLPGSEWRRDNCRYGDWRAGPSFNVAEVKLTVRCAVVHWTPSGGSSVAFCIIEHESGYVETAQNPGSSAGGIFQVVDGTWSGWKQAFAERVRMFDIGAKYDARSNVMLSIMAADAYGWEAWRGSGCY